MRNLQPVFKHFPQFDETNTIVVGPFENEAKDYKPNDMVLDHWDIMKHPLKYNDDVFVNAFVQYIKGVHKSHNTRGSDVRGFLAKYSLGNMEKRLKASTINTGLW